MISLPQKVFAVLLCSICLNAADVDWPVYLGDAASSHFSQLKQITPRNVKNLQVAWTYNCGDGRKDNRSQIQCNPLIIDGIMYGHVAAFEVGGRGRRDREGNLAIRSIRV